MNTEKYYIYALVHPSYPANGKTHYVGLTRNLAQRYKQHLSSNTNWIQQLIDQGEVPKQIILEDELSLEEAKEREKYWIHRFEGEGNALENIVHNEAARREREEEAQLQARLEKEYSDLPEAQAKHLIEITKGAYKHVGYCAWDEAFSIARDTVRELGNTGKLKTPVDAVEIAVLTLRRWNLRWRGEDTYKSGSAGEP